MLKIYFTKNDHEWSEDIFQQMLLPLREDMRKKVLAYKDWCDRQARILSKHLLLRLSGYFNLDLTLDEIKYTEFHKPYFTPKPPKGGLNTTGASAVKVPLPTRQAGFRGFRGTNLNFSTAHSGDIVVCAGAISTEIGIDIEEIVPVDIRDYQEQLTKNEWGFIQNSPDRLVAFYKIWTRKEALLKALGRGIDIDFHTLDVCADRVIYEGKDYWFYTLCITDNYIAHMATSAPFDNGSVSSEMLSDLL